MNLKMNKSSNPTKNVWTPWTGWDVKRYTRWFNEKYYAGRSKNNGSPSDSL